MDNYAPTLNPYLGRLESFSGSNCQPAVVQGFVNAFKLRLAIGRIHNSMDQIHVFGTFLTENAQIWYSNCVLTQVDSFQSIEEVLELFKYRFLPASYSDDAHEKLLGLRQSSSVSNYTKNFHSLVSLIDQSFVSNDAYLHQRYKIGLKAEIRALVELKSTKNLAEAISTAQTVDSILHQGGSDKPSFWKKSNNSNPQFGRSSYPSKYHTAASTAATVANDVDPMDLDSISQGSNLSLCEFCYAKGHSIQNCRTRKRILDHENSQKSTGNERSSSVNEYTSSPVYSINVAPTGPPTRNPISLSIHLKGTKISIPNVLDSGAASYFISESLVKELNLMDRCEQAKHPVSVRVASKAPPIPVNSFIQLPLDIKLTPKTAIQVSLPTYVVPGLQSKLYLGLPFIERYREHLDWTSLTSATLASPVSVNSEKNDSSPEDPTAIIDAITFAREAKNNDIFLCSLETTEQSSTVSLDAASINSDTATERNASPMWEQIIIKEFSDVITDSEPTGLPPSRSINHRIKLIPGTSPTNRQQYRLSNEEKTELNSQVQKLLKQGFIRDSVSPYNSPVLFVKKKDGTLRMCVDFRLLNQHTIRDRFPIPLVDDILSQIGNAKIFSKLDLVSGFHQLRIHEADTEKTAFSTNWGHYEYLVMPFGLTNAPSSFQRLMNGILQPFLGRGVVVYMDDILVYTDTLEDHAHLLRAVLKTLRTNQLQCNLTKCEMFRSRIKFLGHELSHLGIQMEGAKVQTMLNWPSIQNNKEAQRFLGLANYYRRFIQNYSRMVAPMIKYAADTKKTITWSEDCENAFNNLKQALSSSPVLVNPTLSDGNHLVLCTDASTNHLGYVLELHHNQKGLLGVIGYGSKTLTGSQLNYDTRTKEFLGLVEGIRYWEHILKGVPHFTILTDHQSLTYYHKPDTPLKNERINRWLSYLSQFSFTIKYLKGKSNVVADALSRVEELSLMEIQTDLETNPNLKQKIIAAYPQDPSFSTIYNTLKDNLPVPKAIKNHISHFEINHEGLLLFSTNKDDIQRTCIPLPCRNDLIHNSHDLPTAGHLGLLRCYLNLQRLFYWPNMFRHIKKYISSCVTCQKSKPSTKLTQGLLKPLPVPSARFKSISMDFLSGIPLTARKNDMVMVIVDRFSKRCKLVACSKHLTGEEAAKLFLEHYFVNFGLPSSLVSDKDVRFLGSFWKTIWATLGTSLLFTTTSHPATDGQSERQMRILNQMVRATCSQNISNWDLILAPIEFAYNSTVHASTGKAPFEIDLGEIPDSPTYHSSWHSTKTKFNDNADQLVKHFQAVIAQTKDNLIQAQQSQEEQHNRRRRTADYNVGDWVLIHREAWGVHSRYSKFHPYYIGPYQLVKKLNENAFEVALPVISKKQRTLNVEWFRPFIERDARYPKQPPINDPEIRQRIHEITSIVGYNKETKKLKVTWQFCNPIHATTITFNQFNSIKNSALKKNLVEQAQILKPRPVTSSLPPIDDLDYQD